MNYVGLHVHTHYSLMDGVATPEEYVNRAVELGMPALAITDHGTLSGHRELHRIAKAKGIKPILGVEGYMTTSMADKRAKADRTDPLDQNYHHIVLLAKNQIGLENLNKINEIAWTDGFFSKPRFDFDTLKTNFKQFLTSQTVLKDYDFDGSNINVLLDVMSYNSYLNAFYLNMVLKSSLFFSYLY